MSGVRRVVMANYVCRFEFAQYYCKTKSILLANQPHVIIILELYKRRGIPLSEKLNL